MSDRWDELIKAGWRTDHNSAAVIQFNVRPSWYTPSGKRWGFADKGIFDPEPRYPTKQEQALAQGDET